MRTALVTGANDGIGFATAQALLGKGWRVLVHARSQSKAGQAVAALANAGGEAVGVWGDLAELAQVQALAAQAAAPAPVLDVLINNAGVYEQARAMTRDGFERTMGINHFGHLLLTLKLRDALAKSDQPRVIQVSSGVHLGAKLDLDDLDLAHGWSGYGAYGASKLANAVTAAELARRPAWKGVMSFSLHPGVVTTKLLTRNFGTGGIAPAAGARTSVYCATEAGLEGRNGGYFSDSRAAQPNPRVLDPAFGAELWDRSLERLKKWL